MRDFAEHTDIAWNVIGSLLLWTGWYGFNTTGAVHVGDEEWGAVVARIGVNTTLAPATAALVVVIVSWYVLPHTSSPDAAETQHATCGGASEGGMRAADGADAWRRVGAQRWKVQQAHRDARHVGVLTNLYSTCLVGPGTTSASSTCRPR